MGPLKKWIQAACRSSAKAIPFGAACFGIPRSNVVEDEDISDAHARGPRIISGEPTLEDPSLAPIPPGRGSPNGSIDVSSQCSVIMPMEIPEAELCTTARSIGLRSDDDWEGLSNPTTDDLYGVEIMGRQSFGSPPTQRTCIYFSRETEPEKSSCSGQIEGPGSHPSPRIRPVDTSVHSRLGKHCKSPFHGSMNIDGIGCLHGGKSDRDDASACDKDDHTDDRSDDFTDEGEDDDDGDDDDDDNIRNWEKNSLGINHVMSNLISTSGQCSILSSYSAHSVRDNSAYETSSSEGSWSSSSKVRTERETVSKLQLALYKKSLGSSMEHQLDRDASLRDLKDEDTDSACHEERPAARKIFDQLFHVDEPGHRTNSSAREENPRQTFQSDKSARKMSFLGRSWKGKSPLNTQSKSLRSTSSFFAQSRPCTKNQIGKMNSLGQKCEKKQRGRSMHWLFCGATSFDREVNNFDDPVHRQAHAARGAARYQRRQELLVHRIEVALKEDTSSRQRNPKKRRKREKVKSRSGPLQLTCPEDRPKPPPEIDSAFRGVEIWPKLRDKFFPDLQKPRREAMKKEACHSRRGRSFFLQEKDRKSIALPLTAR